MIYTFSVQYLDEIINVFIEHGNVFYEEVMYYIGQYLFNLKDSFELEVFNSDLQKYIDFDEEYAEELRQTTDNIIIKCRVLVNKIQAPSICSNENPCSPLCLTVDSPGGMSVSDDLGLVTPDIDAHVCRHDELFIEPDDDVKGSSFIIFNRDVAQTQRTSFLTNRKQLTIPKKNSFVTRIQGIKTDYDKKHVCVLPEIKLPLREFLEYESIQLYVGIVIEDYEEDRFKWFLNTNQGFLYDDAEIDSMPCNPICLGIDRSVCTDDGIYKLPLRMCTLTGDQKNNRGRLFHTLNSKFAKKLHSAEHQSNTPRLACVLTDENHNIYWKTFGLSNFMQPRNSKTSKHQQRDGKVQRNSSSSFIYDNKTSIARYAKIHKKADQSLKRLA